MSSLKQFILENTTQKIILQIRLQLQEYGKTHKLTPLLKLSMKLLLLSCKEALDT